MPSIELNVPYDEKDLARSQGARWNPQRKTWFVPDGMDCTPFKKWLPDPPRITVRATHYFIAETGRTCWKCERKTRVFAFVLPAGHETWSQLDDSRMNFSDDDEYTAWLESDASVGWVREPTPGVVFYIRHLPEAVQIRMKSLTECYRRDFSRTTQNFYWMNHCGHCGMKQGDYELFEEFAAPFQPLCAPTSGISLVAIREPFEAEASSMSDRTGIFSSTIRVISGSIRR